MMYDQAWQNLHDARARMLAPRPVWRYIGPEVPDRAPDHWELARDVEPEEGKVAIREFWFLTPDEIVRRRPR